MLNASSKKTANPVGLPMISCFLPAGASSQLAFVTKLEVLAPVVDHVLLFPIKSPNAKALYGCQDE